MDLKTRLYAFLDAKNITAFAFEKACGLSNGFCSKVNGFITNRVSDAIHKTFPDLNMQWLKTGEGEMFIQNPSFDIHEKVEPEDSNMLAMVKMMQEFISLGKKNSEANLLNAEANKLNAQNLERLIALIEHKVLS